MDVGTTALTETAQEKLRMTVDRIERLEEEKREVAEQIKEVYGEAKALGYDTKALRSGGPYPQNRCERPRGTGSYSRRLFARIG